MLAAIREEAQRADRRHAHDVTWEDRLARRVAQINPALIVPRSRRSVERRCFVVAAAGTGTSGAQCYAPPGVLWLLASALR